MSDLPQITYGNMALIFLSHFHGYNKNEIYADYWDTECFFLMLPHLGPVFQSMINILIS
jgi:hypothetical protein